MNGWQIFIKNNAKNLQLREMDGSKEETTNGDELIPFVANIDFQTKFNLIKMV